MVSTELTTSNSISTALWVADTLMFKVALTGILRGYSESSISLRHVQCAVYTHTHAHTHTNAYTL
jgi:hypothetical protein